MRPQSVEIKVTLAGTNVGEAVAALGLSQGLGWRIVFCQDVTTGVAPLTPLLDIGVLLRARRKSGTTGDSTVKLRPCRWSQLSDDFSFSRETDVNELKIEADWAGPRRTLDVSLTAEWDDDRVVAVQSGRLPPGGLFDQEQRRFLRQCSNGLVNLDVLTALADITATRWKEFPAKVDGLDLNVRAERWVIDGAIDLLELSIVSDLVGAERDQAALQHFLARHSLTVEQKDAAGTELSYRSRCQHRIACAGRRLRRFERPAVGLCGRAGAIRPSRGCASTSWSTWSRRTARWSSPIVSSL